MSFVSNPCQQLSVDDRFLQQSDRTKKFIVKSWAKPFADIIFPAINEERFSVLYSDNAASRPNTSVNQVVGALILQALMGLTEDELLESILCDIRFQYALHTTSFEEQPFSDRTFSRFRERLYMYTMETGVDLLHEEMEAMAEVFLKYMNINPNVKRMDSLMISSSCKKMTRLEIIYQCVANMVKVVSKTREMLLLQGFENYLKAEDLNDTIYHCKGEELTPRLQKVVDDAVKLLSLLKDAYGASAEYELLQRVISEQTEKISPDQTVPKKNKDIKANSLQNPSDPDATFRSKAGKSNKGYVGNLVEAFDDNGAIITNYDYQVNSYSDNQFCKDVIEKHEAQEEKSILITDGAYGSVENVELAAQKNIELITTALLGKSPNAEQADFQIDSKINEVISCPAGHKPYKCTHYEKIDSYRASYNKKTCIDCPLQGKCGVKFQKKSAVVTVTEKMIQRATHIKKMTTEAYLELSKKRNAVEGLPSILRRRYRVDHMPVRGLVRSKIMFSFKVGAINAKRVIVKALANAWIEILRIIKGSKCPFYVNSSFLRSVF